jgi:hypothetical protein
VDDGVNRAVTQTRTTGVVAALLVTEAVLRTALHAVEWYDAVLWHRYLTGQPVSFDEIDTADGIGALVLFLHLPTMVAGAEHEPRSGSGRWPGRPRGRSPCTRGFCTTVVMTSTHRPRQR